MVENIKKTKGFIETPQQIVWIMSQWVSLSKSETIADFTAGRGALLSPYAKENCYGIELDVGNHAALIHQGYANILLGDFFDKINEFNDNSIDALVMNPPYGRLGKGKTSMGMLELSLDKIKPDGRVAIICAQNDFVRFKEADAVFSKMTVDIAYRFGDSLFKPFASVPTVLVLGRKAVSPDDHEICVVDIPNGRIQINTRAKHPEPRLNVKETEEKQVLQSNFRENITGLFVPPSRPPTLSDFKKTVIDYMAWEYRIPREALESPKEFWDGFHRMVEDYQLAHSNCNLSKGNKKGIDNERNCRL